MPVQQGGKAWLPATIMIARTKALPAIALGISPREEEPADARLFNPLSASGQVQEPTHLLHASVTPALPPPRAINTSVSGGRVRGRRQLQLGTVQAPSNLKSLVSARQGTAAAAP
ncbi:hypothetical protein NDU88_007444 [Pleurodeles waltl]|uniref:Uncharacterized protein n=1 Tax=Pleurodeles waltl TaxID=8319 RepID=A0AAV7PTL7_PLEWA|nr:hypothetical protein NDU88_007444 [Pleurodeles waltl]